MSAAQIAVIAAVIVVLGVIVFPLINRRLLRNLPPDQQVRIIMKEARGLAYFKNISNGSSGTLVFVKNKRKILLFNWVLRDGKMLCTDKKPFERWDYPEEKPPLNEDELELVKSELEKYNKKNPIKIEFIYK